MLRQTDAVLDRKSVLLWAENSRITYSSIKNKSSGSRSVVVKVLNFDAVVNDFEIQSRHYVHFRTNTCEKGMNTLIPLVGG